MTIRIVLADDHTLIRECLWAVLDKVLDIEVLAEAESGLAVVQLARELRPDVVLMDIGMKELNGIDATRRITAESPEVKVLILSVHSAKRYVVEALNAGARGFIQKDCASEELVDAIRTVARNGLHLSRELKALIGIEEKRGGAIPVPILTNREREILVMFAEGKSSRDIAEILQISTKTVETHRSHFMKKLNLNNIAGLTKYALREGLLLLD